MPKRNAPSSPRHRCRLQLTYTVILLLTGHAVRSAESEHPRIGPSPNGDKKEQSTKRPQPWFEHGPLRAASGGHYLEHADGTPFVWVGDTAWVLHQNLRRDEVLGYLDDCAAKGFTVIQFMSVNPWALADGKNAFGEPPHLDDSAAKLNRAFWGHLAWVIEEAGRRGLFALLVYGSPGRTDDHGPVTSTPAEAYAYGNVVGAFFRDRPNLIWCGGIDVNPDDVKRVSPMGMAGWHAMAEGVCDGVVGVNRFDGESDWGATLMTYHPRGNSTSSTWFHEAPWLDFNGAQVGWRDKTLIETISADVARRPAKPVVNLEPWYEECTWKKPPVDDWDVRLQAYQTILSGAAGHTYGHASIYPFDSLKEEGGFRWRDCLDARGRRQMRHLRTFLDRMPALGRVPLPEFVKTRLDGAHAALELRKRIAAMGGIDGSWAAVYSPSGETFTAELSQLRGPRTQSQWFDPRNGETKPPELLPTDAAWEFDPPGGAGEGMDWVLLLHSPAP